MEILILCNENDAIADALFQQVSTNSKEAYLVTATELSLADSWVHEISTNGKVTTEIKLQNGKVIRSDELKVVWNRIRFFPMLHFQNADDRYYAQNEMSALFFSFLNSINQILINPVRTHDLAMEGENLLYLKQQAINAGLKVTDHHFTSSPKWKMSRHLASFDYDKKETTTFRKKAPHLIWQNQPSLLIEPSTGIAKCWIVGENVIGTNSIPEQKALKKLSANLNKILLEVDFATTLEGVKLRNINTFPLFAPAEVIEALTGLLLQKTKQKR